VDETKEGKGVTMQHTMRVLGRRGDTPVSWDPADAAATATAKAAFVAMRRAGMLAFKGEPGEEVEQLDSFDAEAKEIIFARPIAGG